MKKLCARCGIIFDAGDDNTKKFCSGKCEKLFAESSLGYIKKGNQTERRVYASDLILQKILIKSFLELFNGFA